MAIVQRLTFLLLLLFSTQAFAFSTYARYNSTGSNVLYDTTQLACNGFIADRKITFPTHNIAFISLTPAGLGASCAYSDNVSGNSSRGINPQYVCGENPNVVVADYLTRVCSLPYQPPCSKDAVVATGIFSNGLDPNAPFPNTACDGSCNVAFTGNWPSKQSCNAKGVCTYYALGEYTKTGLTCSGASSMANQVSSVPPSATKSEIASSLASDVAASKALTDAADAAKLAALQLALKSAVEASTAANVQAAKSAAHSVTVNNNPAATAGEKSAADAAASADKAAAATAAGTAATKGAVSIPNPDKVPEFCSLHPNSIICKNSTIYAGSCVGGVSTNFHCDGDAIQCAIAQEQQKRNCEFYATDDALTAKFAADKLASQTGTADVVPHTIVNLPTSLNATGTYAAECNPDLTFAFNGASITIPLSAWCGYLTAIGYLFLTMSYLSAAVILGGVV